MVCAQVGADLAGRGMALFLWWEQRRAAHPDGMSHPTWNRRLQSATKKQNEQSCASKTIA